MEFFPLTLGVQEPRARREEKREEGGNRGPGASRRPTYEVWREGLSGPEEEVDAHPAEDVLRRLMHEDPALPPRPWVLLGEPGAGKTSLLEHWHATWLRALERPRLGMRVPVLVRLRDVPRGAFAGDPALVADGLWAKGLAAAQDKARGTAAAAAFALPGRLVTPVWLLDGLDEMGTPLADAGLWDALRALPGEAVLSCRTAVFQPARAEVAGRIAGEWRILGLRSEEEQARFLAQAYAAEGRDPARAPGVVRALNANPALRPLAAVPLLLGLVAEAGDRLVLPATRAAFYEAATAALWERRLRDRPALLALAPARDAALAALAASMGLKALETKPEALCRAGMTPELREALRRSGLLRFDDRRERVGFPHLTFQEYHLARAWLERPFAAVLEEHWADPRHEEALALLIALHAQEGRVAMVEAALRAFVAGARAAHAAHRERLWSVGRSPLRTALHLLARAAVSPNPTLPISLPTEPLLVRLAIARDDHAPAAALAELARDPEREVRRAVAGNAAAPAAALAELGRDPDEWVRRWAAAAAAAPAALAELGATRTSGCGGRWRGTRRRRRRPWPSWGATRTSWCGGGWRGTRRPCLRTLPSRPHASRFGAFCPLWLRDGGVGGVGGASKSRPWL